MIKKIKSQFNVNKVALVLTIVSFGAIGYVLLRGSLAADSIVDVQAENMTATGGASTGSDTNASSGQYFKFGSASGSLEPILPNFTGTCPTIKSGQVSFPSDSNRVVHFRMDSNASTKGPLIFLWHGQQTADTTDSEANSIGNNLLGSTTVTNLVNAGAVLAIMKMHTASTWDNASSWSTSNRDLNLVDAVTACANNQGHIDSKRIHSIGMSWGGYQTSHLAFLRANYIASAVVMSGGFTGSPPSSAIQRPENKFATITTLGSTSAGELQVVVSPLQGYRDYAKSAGHFVVHCQHSGGHIPISGGGPMHQRFFQDHYYGVPKAYTTLPVPPFLSSCSIY
ncbi:hypothetical protein DYH10_01665 [Candidatus Saccharibacteria bacterium CPR2]|nr:hypothetical protein [Candidatus Saccharibacteria bacterium CPR2]